MQHYAADLRAPLGAPAFSAADPRLSGMRLTDTQLCVSGNNPSDTRITGTTASSFHMTLDAVPTAQGADRGPAARGRPV